jgi:hypothetical protein
MCHWSFEELRQTIGGLRLIATWAHQARRALSAVFVREAPAQPGAPKSATSLSQLSASSSAPAFASSERDP